MSDEHRRPLFAFVIVALACGLLIANAMRSEAVSSLLRAGVAQVVAGVAFVPDFVDGSPPSTTVKALPQAGARTDRR